MNLLERVHECSSEVLTITGLGCSDCHLLVGTIDVCRHNDSSSASGLRQVTLSVVLFVIILVINVPELCRKRVKRVDLVVQNDTFGKKLLFRKTIVVGHVIFVDNGCERGIIQYELSTNDLLKVSKILGNMVWIHHKLMHRSQLEVLNGRVLSNRSFLI
jgi:hypothetical protein